MSQPSTPVLVLGMHRSGTSYLASVLAAMGVKMGESLLSADSGNPRGYFEDVSVLAFHNKLLAHRLPASQTRANFLAGPDFDPAWNAGEDAEADALLEKLRCEGLWGWKEPRTCLFLEQWLRKMPDARCIAVYRHPLEIYYSFLKRKDWSALFAPESVFEATAAYNEAILAARLKAPEQFLVLHAGVSFAGGVALAERLAEFLEVPAPKASALPPFAAGEFSSLNVVPEQHALMSITYPRATRAYDMMQIVADKQAQFGGDDGRTPIPTQMMALIAAALECCGSVGFQGGSGQAVIDAFCMNVPAAELRRLRAGIAEAVDAEIAEISADRDKYVASFEKYKALYDNYFDAWRGSDRTLVETRDWVNRDLIPKIVRWRKQLQDLGVPYEE